MSAWILVPSLVALREEFNAVAPNRDRGADGAIGDSSHTSSSDHTPDEDSDVLSDHDADSKNEVHAVDVDCTGPWPDGRGGEGGGWFDRSIRSIVDQERSELHSTDVFGRLEYVIWRGRIASRSRGWAWRDYIGPSAHFDHAHFSARYLTRTESDTRPWGVYEEDDMQLSDKMALTGKTQAALGIAPEGGVMEFGSYLGTLGIRVGEGQKAAQQAVNDVTMVRSDLAKLAAQVAQQGPATGGAVDLEALAELVTQKLAARLQS